MASAASVLRAMFVGGLLLMLAGILLIAVYGTLEFIGPVYDVMGVLLLIVGGVWTWKVNNLMKRKKKTRYSTYRNYVIPILLTLMMGLALANTVFAQSFSKDCYVMYRRVQYVEYTLIGLLIISGFLAFGPIILGRTILGPILQELQYIAGAMLILLIFALLVVFPLDPMFVLDNPKSPTACYINIQNLASQGPPFLQIILRLFTPPPPSFT